jgi:hypothetical protein
MRAWGAGVSAGYAALGVVGAAVLHVPGSELFFGPCALFTLALALLVAPLLRPRGDGDGDGGIGPPQPPDEPPPPWWPEFEREFRAYAERLTSVRGAP